MENKSMNKLKVRTCISSQVSLRLKSNCRDIKIIQITIYTYCILYFNTLTCFTSALPRVVHFHWNQWSVTVQIVQYGNLKKTLVEMAYVSSCISDFTWKYQHLQWYVVSDSLWFNNIFTVFHLIFGLFSVPKSSIEIKTICKMTWGIFDLFSNAVLKVKLFGQQYPTSMQTNSDTICGTVW